jgi:hypothetical protein
MSVQKITRKDIRAFVYAKAETAPNHGLPADWVRRFRHERAHHLITAGRHNLAVPLSDGILATGDHVVAATRG